MGDAAFTVLWELWLCFQKLSDLALCGKAARGKSLQRFLNNRGHRLVSYQLFAVTLDVFIAKGRPRIHIVAVCQTRFHTVDGLLSVLLGKMLRGACQHIFQKLGIGIIAKDNRGAFQYPASLREFVTKLNMSLQTAR
nr:hypothetical protein [Parasphingorhabdus flavimaris]